MGVSPCCQADDLVESASRNVVLTTMRRVRVAQARVANVGAPRADVAEAVSTP